MSDSTLCLKPINDLLKERFFIPSYQRGYRWSARQVMDLLDDIFTFQRESDRKGKEAFYCLQPVVVTKRPAGDWEVIDGQQRLTTIFLILTFLRPLLDILQKTRYSLRYATREDSGTFLEHIDPSRINENIDYYHICSAYQTIQHWFEARDGNDRLLFLQCLLNSDDAGKNVKVIWYELPNRENPVDVFIRLNMGKIPLTNAELIRALFLRSHNFRGSIELRQLQIAQEWDGIEKVLQADDFWYFIHKGDVSYPTRIEYLFQLITQEAKPAPDISHDDYYTFIAYSRRFTDVSASAIDECVSAEWLKVKRFFMTCEEWYRDRTLYHLIGYLITEGIPIPDLIRAVSEDRTKRAFRQALKGKVFTRLFGATLNASISTDAMKNIVREKLAEFNYEDHKSAIRSVLLLFNIATLLQNSASNLRFPFDSYKKEENWDIEHIRSVMSDKPGRIDAQKQWLGNVLEYWSGSGELAAQCPDGSEQAALCKDITDLLDASTFDTATFDTLYDRILACFEENGSSETDHGLANLALLDAHTNRSYKNAVFPIKRRHILRLDKAGTFVPLCTTNVFLKYYSSKVHNMMFWSEGDRNDYFNAIVDTLVDFFTPRNGGMT
jgi:hypothetical protein